MNVSTPPPSARPEQNASSTTAGTDAPPRRLITHYASFSVVVTAILLTHVVSRYDVEMGLGAYHKGFLVAEVLLGALLVLQLALLLLGMHVTSLRSSREEISADNAKSKQRRHDRGETSDPNSVEICKSLLAQIKFTKGARFEAARRHKLRTRTSQLSIIILSVYVFFISAALIVFDGDLTPMSKNWLSAANLTMSVFILAFSLLEAGKRHDLRSEILLKSAQMLSELYDTTNLQYKLGLIDEEAVSEAVARYHKIIADLSDNHDDIDYLLFRLKIGRMSGYSRFLKRTGVRAAYLFDIWKIPAIALLSPLGVLAIYLLANYMLEPLSSAAP